MNKHNNKVFNYLFLIVLIILFLTYLFISYSNSTLISNEKLQGIKVSYLDVGQADSILIQVDNDSVLIDAGNNSDGKNLVEYIHNQNINSFKYVFGTHAHEDHIGGMDDIILNFDIDHFYMPNVITTTKTFEDVLDALEARNIRFETPGIDDSFNIGAAKIEVLYVGDDEKNLNNTSIVLKIIYKNIKFLFMGDLEKDIEKKLLGKDIKSDVLKVGHHGSSTSSSDEFIKRVNPMFGIISVGRDNSYKHPSKKTLDILNRYNVNVLRTDQMGSIIVTSDGEKINYYGISTNIDGK